ncbi:MAG: 2-hydroxyacid dehydrogenase [Promethearchaeota archaeon]
MNKPKVFFTSNVFSAQEIGSNEKINLDIRETIKKLWLKLNKIAEIKFFNGRFPTEEQIKNEIENFNPEILGCHLSHPISSTNLENSNIFAVSTSTAGYNHIQRPKEDNILITHTPGVLHQTVADYTIALILSNLRNIIDLHNYVWEGKWLADEKWDLDQSLSSIIDNKILGIIGLGEIGQEIVKKLYPWGLKILYYDITRKQDIEEKYPNIEFRSSLEEIFSEADIISLHMPLNKHTKNIINRELLIKMKNNSLLINTARGPILDLDALLDLLENKDISINLSFDVFPEEPLNKEYLERFKKIKNERPELRMIFMPHNASADADTRGKMDILFLEDIIKIIESNKIEDLNNLHVIPEHKNQLNTKKWKIIDYWSKK